MSEAISKKERAFILLAMKKIRQGAAAFNEWRESQGRKWFKLTGKEFNGLMLDGVDFRGMKFTGSSFRGTSLQGAKFVSANVNRVDFTGAKLADADFRGARMYQAILDNAEADGLNLSQTLRDGWSIKGIQCGKCWITKNKAESPDLPDFFKPGEFEAVYGGTKVRVVFPDGFQPIDLMALPFYVKSFADKFAGKHLVFVGLNTLETPSLEFRVEDATVAAEVGGDMQQHFNREVSGLRATVTRELAEKNNHISALIESLNLALLTIKETKMIEDKRIEVHVAGNSGTIQVGGSGNQITNITGNNIKEINFGDATHMAELGKQLQDLIEKLPSRNDTTAQDKQLLVEATAAAKANDEPKVRNALKKAGGWLLKFANDVGVSLVADAIKQSAGIK